MNKNFYILLVSILAAIGILSPNVWARSETYNVSVTIPAIPGVNVPPFTSEELIRYQKVRQQYHNPVTEDELQLLLEQSHLTAEVDPDGSTSAEEFWQDNRKIILQTILDK